jgi:hypothetical protein
MSTEPGTRVNYVFVDYENVQDIDLSIIGAQAVHFTLLLGLRNKKLDADVVEKLLANAASVQLVRLSADGRNALDFTLAYYVGRAAAMDPAGFYHIVSRDKGYDPLVAHLRSKHIEARRHDSFASLPFSKWSTPAVPTVSQAAAVPRDEPQKSPAPMGAAPQLKAMAPALDDAATRILTHLRAHPRNRPKRKRTLSHHLPSILGNQINEVEALKLIETLRRGRHLAIDDKGVVTYNL